MRKTAGEGSRTRQYVIGAVVAVIVFCVWIYIPLMQSSSMDSSVSSNGYFKTMTADVGSLGDEIPQESGAPGYAISGEMLNNPATSGENTASSLFQSGPEDTTAAVTGSAGDSGNSSPPLPGVSAFAGAPGSYSPDPKGKLNAVPSISAGGSNSMTAGGAHNKFFGSGADKTDFASGPDSKNAAAADKRGSLVDVLFKTAEKSAKAARLGNPTAAAAGANSAFEKVSRGDAHNLNTGMEQAAASSGLALGAAAQDLKRSDPNLSGKKINLPRPVADKDKDGTEEMIKKMLIQMVISSVLGPMFGTMFGAAAGGGATAGAGK
jgi:hypothetical protein